MKTKFHRVSLGLLALVTLGGCASFNDIYYEKTQRTRASKEYAHCGTPQCSEYPRDYKKGWIDGFYEVATGGSDCPPAVAPAKYYEPKEILKYCDKRRLAYYSGWQGGAARATQFPDTHYLRIYETQACPFPRCEKPCSDGSCAPCREAFVGMSATANMIEAGPMKEIPGDDVEGEGVEGEGVEGEGVPATAIEYRQSKPDNAVELTIPKLNEFEPTPAATTPPKAQSISVPVPKPKPAIDMLTDLPTLPLLPLPDAAAAPAVPELNPPLALETVAKSAADAEQTPLVSIPGYRATTQWSRPAATSMKAQSAGFIRMVKPIRDPQQVQFSDVVEPIVIVEAPYQHYKMSDTDAEVQPVIKLVE